MVGCVGDTALSRRRRDARSGLRPPPATQIASRATVSPPLRGRRRDGSLLQSRGARACGFRGARGGWWRGVGAASAASDLWWARARHLTKIKTQARSPLASLPAPSTQRPPSTPTGMRCGSSPRRNGRVSLPVARIPSRRRPSVALKLRLRAALPSPARGSGRRSSWDRREALLAQAWPLAAAGGAEQWSHNVPGGRRRRGKRAISECLRR